MMAGLVMRYGPLMVHKLRNSSTLTVAAAPPDLQVIANLAVRGLNGIILRVNYVVFFFPSA